jgi:hypothetical protein
MRHLCKNMQKAVQNTATRLLTIIEISGPSLSNTAPVPEGRLSRIHFTYHKIISVPVIHPAVALEAGDSQGEPQPDGTVMRHHGVHIIHKGGLSKGPFLLQLETDPATKKPILPLIRGLSNDRVTRSLLRPCYAVHVCNCACTDTGSFARNESN